MMKETNKKALYNGIWDLIKQLENYGVVFYSLTINPTIRIREESTEYLFDYIIILKENLNNNIELINFIQIIPELNTNNNWHFHAIIGVKSLIGYNEVLKDNIYNYLLHAGYLDINFKHLKKDKDIYNWWVYIFKEVIKSTFIC